MVQITIRGNIRLELKGTLFGFTIAVDTAVGGTAKDEQFNWLCQGAIGTVNAAKIIAAVDEAANLKALQATVAKMVKDAGEPHPHPLSPVKSVYTCPVCANTDATTLLQGQFKDGVAFVVDADELIAARAPNPADRNLSLNVYDVKAITGHVIASGKPYFCILQNAAEADYYATMVQLVRETPNKAYIGRFALKGATKPYQLGIFEDALTITPLAWPSDIRQAPQSTGTPDVTLIEQAKMLADLAVIDFDADDYTNARSASIAALIDAATAVPGFVDATGKPPTPVKAASNPLADALAASVAAAKAAKAATAAPTKRAPAKKAAPKAVRRAKAKV